MKVLYEEELSSAINSPTAITVGTFDGVHLGHQLILEELLDLAHTHQLTSLLFTFLQHPRHVLYQENSEVPLLTTPEEKIYLLKPYDLDFVFFKHFTLEFAKLQPEVFIQQYLFEQLHARALVVGFDHTFGKNKEGSISTIEKCCQKNKLITVYVKPLEIEGFTVSSSIIRKLLLRGEITLANRLLGHPYLIMGKVIHGDHRGKMLGFPTANIQPLHPDKLLPQNGVYTATLTIRQHTYQGMINIGTRPTFNGKNTRTEIHIFDFEENIYDEIITIFLHHRLRNEIKFASENELISQLQKDKAKALAMLGNLKS